MTGLYPGSKQKVRTYTEISEVEESKIFFSSPRKAVLKGMEVNFYTIGELARLLNRKPVTIRKWEIEGVIPKATFIAPADDKRGKRRLYTEDQILGLVEIAREEGVLEANARGSWKALEKTNFSSRAVELFRRLNEGYK